MTSAADLGPSLSGVCHVVFAHDIGLSIDLDEAERRIKAERETLKHRRRAPRYFEYRPPPLRVSQETPSREVGTGRTAGRVDLVLYDFGAVSVTYAIPFNGRLADLISLSEALYDHTGLLDDARARVEQLATAVASAIAKPSVAGLVESYAIFAADPLEPGVDLEALFHAHAGTIARVLRSEPGELSRQEIEDATACRISYAPDDLAVIDWDAALVIGVEPEDVCAVLEFANVELLEMRYLDQRLDDALDDAYDVMVREKRLLRRPGASQADLRRVGRMQVDAAVLFEGVNNALKLVGEQYLARLYRLASERFHLAEWDGSILRKLQTLESIYEKMSDAAANRRLEVLEWIIILLIAVSIVIPFLPGAPGH